ncbi:hypothetical protein EJ110_NYTH10146 [Nymphaea thermarum]|nr:hypothetical protein EJ110_NYTH10146 [Nymphaea thermarum]
MKSECLGCVNAGGEGEVREIGCVFYFEKQGEIANVESSKEITGGNLNEDSKARGIQAAPYFTLTRYKKFAETKGVVLIRGDTVFSSKLSDSNAQCLATFLLGLLGIRFAFQAFVRT